MDKLRSFLQQQGILKRLDYSSPWSQLVQFESVDIVKDRLKVNAGTSALDAKAFDIATHFAQGRQFFESAERSSPLIRPLLLYYGVLGLSRGLILFKSTLDGNPNLSAGHGLRLVKWEEALEQERQNILDLRLEVVRGTFSDITTVLRNADAVIAMDWERTAYPLKVEGSSAFPRKYAFNAQDIFSRIPDLHDVYELVTGTPSQAIPAYVRFLPGIQSDYYILDPSRQITNTKELLRSIGLTPDGSMELEFTDYQYPVGHINNLHFTADSETSTRSVGHYSAPLRSDTSGMLFLTKFMPEEVNLSSLSLLFAASYIQGMLARYFPSFWAASQSKGHGDRYQLLLTSASEAVTTRYPSLVLQLLLDEFDYRPLHQPYDS